MLLWKYWLVTPLLSMSQVATMKNQEVAGAVKLAQDGAVVVELVFVVTSYVQ
jgi:hypothetical protein